MSSRNHAGKGVIYIAGAKGYFVLTAYAVQLLMPRLLGSPKDFGTYAIVIGVAAMVNNVLIVSAVQCVSKFVSANRDQAAARLFEGLRVQAGVGLGLATLMYLGAPFLAHALKDPSLVPLIRLLPIVILGYAIYAAFVGFLNGQQKFANKLRSM